MARIEEQIKKLGFEFKSEKPFLSMIPESRFKDWFDSEFIKEGNPKLSLTLRKHEEYGINVVIHSTSFDDNYHYNTGKPTNEEGALKVIKNYLQSHNLVE